MPLPQLVRDNDLKQNTSKVYTYDKGFFSKWFKPKYNISKPAPNVVSSTTKGAVNTFNRNIKVADNINPSSFNNLAMSQYTVEI